MPNNFRRALIFGGGPAPRLEWLKTLYRPGDCIVAADRGALLAQSCDLKIDYLLGDFDSLPQEDLKYWSTQCKHLDKFPADKDYSDLELALRKVHTLGISEALLAGALYGRLDHCLFNIIAILQLADELGIKATLASENCQINQANAPGHLQWQNHQEKLLSLMALDNSSVVSLTGCRWPLHEEALLRNSTRGLSNVIVSDKAELTCHRGRVLAILSQKQ